MLSILFGKKATEPVRNKPWDELASGAISIPIWRTDGKDGRVRFVFGFSRPIQNGERFAKTFGPENLWDLLRGLEELCVKLASRRDISRRDREIALVMQEVLERALGLAADPNAKAVNGHGDPNR